MLSQAKVLFLFVKTLWLSLLATHIGFSLTIQLTTVHKTRLTRISKVNATVILLMLFS